jgi:flagellar motor switch protein FliM
LTTQTQTRQRNATGATEPARDVAAIASAQVAARDFHKPQRWSPAQLASLRKRVVDALPQVHAELKTFLRDEHEMTLTAIDEVSSEGLFRDLAAPLALQRFDVGGQPGWLVWETAAAVAAVEVALGQAAPEQATTRPLTSVERTLLGRMLASVIKALTKGLDLETERHRIVEELDAIGTWRDGGAKADPQRLHLGLSFQGPSAPSVLHVYLPSPSLPAATPTAPTPKAALPARLAEISVTLAARLGAVEVPLAELLAIEVGDVIPLDLPLGSPLSIEVEDLPCMTAVLGRSQGKLALRIVDTDVERDPSP